MRRDETDGAAGTSMGRPAYFLGEPAQKQNVSAVTFASGYLRDHFFLYTHGRHYNGVQKV